jgi:uncharacterized membrane protein YvlD (DUF360 family)
VLDPEEKRILRILIRLALKALAFMYLLPLIPGIQFHGGFLAAACLAILFGVMLWVVELVAMALAAYLTIATLGIALLVLIPVWILGFWIMPAVALSLVADFMPQYLSVHGTVSAALGGLFMLVVAMLTGGVTSIRDSVKR